MYSTQVKFNTKIVKNELSHYLQTYFYIFRVDNNHFQQIGSGSVIIIDFQHNNVQQVKDYFSSESSDVMDVLDNLNISSSITEQRLMKPAPTITANDVYGKLCILESISLAPQFQEKDYGKEAIQQVLDYISLMGSDFTILKPYPLEYGYLDKKDLDLQPELEDKIYNMISFYNQYGFETSEEENHICMILNYNKSIHVNS